MSGQVGLQFALMLIKGRGLIPDERHVPSALIPVLPVGTWYDAQSKEVMIIHSSQPHLFQPFTSTCPLWIPPHQAMALELYDPISSFMGLQMSMIQHGLSQQTKLVLLNFDFLLKKKYFIYFEGE